MNRRAFLASLSATLAGAAQKLPANQNIKWAVSAGLWGHFRKVPFTDILDVMRDTGFIGVRLTGFPGILKTYDITAAQMEKECSKRNVHVVTISFGGPAHDPAQEKKVLENAKVAINFLKNFGAKHLVVFSPSRLKAGADVDAAFKQMCQCYNHLGEVAREMGFTAGLWRRRKRWIAAWRSPIPNCSPSRRTRRTCIWAEATWSKNFKNTNTA